jgi:predicted transcriptional regulator
MSEEQKSQNPDSDSVVTKKQALLQMLQSSPNGITNSEIIASLKITTNSLYSTIHALRNDGVSIINMKGKYKLSNKKSNLPVLQKSIPKPINDVNHDISTSIPPRLLKKLENLPESDRNDFLDMFKKSVFYRLSAEAIIHANSVVDDVKNQFKGGL